MQLSENTPFHLVPELLQTWPLTPRPKSVYLNILTANGVAEFYCVRSCSQGECVLGVAALDSGSETWPETTMSSNGCVEDWAVRFAFACRHGVAQWSENCYETDKCLALASISTGANAQWRIISARFFRGGRRNRNFCTSSPRENEKARSLSLVPQ